MDQLSIAICDGHQSFFVNISKVIGMKTDGFIMKDFTVPKRKTVAKFLKLS